MVRKIHALPSEYGARPLAPDFMAGIAWLNWLTIVLALSLLYRVILLPTRTVGFAAYAGLCYWLTLPLDTVTDIPVWQIGGPLTCWRGSASSRTTRWGARRSSSSRMCSSC
ncbi:hypothetical protein SAMN05444002_3075 [Vannielia litorea]|uniref:Uncharacterized protein n=1 Tax=Vannielia litorea TaxID=1217970 RepID=A0A1N6H4N2_9RHOB|nr:hypothetical protein SAMN05444002_3075 [Vannielia litorea]